MKLIIQDYSFGDYGGMSIYVQALINQLLKNRDIEITVITTDKQNMPSPTTYRIIKVPFKGGRLSLMNWSNKCKKILSGLKKKGEVDLINLHIPPVLPGLFMIPGVPYVVTAHNPHYAWSQALPYKLSWANKATRIALEKRIMKKAKYIITLTQDAHNAIAKLGIDKKKIFIIPNGTNTAAFSPKKVKKDIDILFVGRIEVMKGSHAMIKICKMLASENKNIKIGIVGYGPDYELVKEQLRKEISAGNVIMIGKVKPKDVPQYYQRAKLYMSTSYTEGLPTVCIEAMSCEVPPIGWDLKFHRNLILDKKTGFLIPLDDFETMKNTALTILKKKDIMASIGKRARKTIQSNYEWENIGVKIRKIYLGATK